MSGKIIPTPERQPDGAGTAQGANMLDLKGVIPALPTPFHADGALDLDGVRTLVELSIEDGVHAVIPYGSMAEPWAIKSDERAALLKAAVAQAAGRVPVVAGVNGITPDSAIEEARQAEAAGCDVLMINGPTYARPGQDELYDYFIAFIRATDLPVMLYNIPHLTGVGLGVDLIDRLADEPQVVALKDSAGDWGLHVELIRRCADRLNVFTHVSAMGLGAFAEGATGFVYSGTPVLGRRSRQFYDLVCAGDYEAARPLQVQMGRFSSGVHGIGTSPAGLKAAIDLVGRPGGFPRPPIKALSEDQRAEVRAVLVKVGVLSAS